MNNKKYLITRLCCVGDVIYSIPLIKTIKKNDPDAKITYVVTDWCKQIIEMVPEIDEFIVFDAPYQKISIFSKIIKVLDLWIKMLSGNYSIGINLHRSSFFAILFFFSRIKIRIGFGNSIFLNEKVFYDDTIHESKKFLSLLTPLGFNRIIDVPEINPSQESINSVDKIFKDCNFHNNSVLIGVYADGGKNPGQIMEIRQLNAEKYTDVIKNILRKYENVIFLLINSKEGKGNAEKIHQIVQNERCILLSKLTLKQISAVAKKCKMFIGGDTGILHLAAAVGTPVIMFYGPDNPNQWAPLSKNSKIIFHKIECSPCYTPTSVKDKNNFIDNTFICRRGDVLCMQSITTEEIVSAIEEIMNG